MATRQEMAGAINLIRHTARSNGHFKEIIDKLDGKFELTYPLESGLKNDPHIPLSFDDKKALIDSERSFLKGLTDRVKTVIDKADSTFLDNGITDISYRVVGAENYYRQQDIDSDVVGVNGKCKETSGSISLSVKDSDLKAIASNLKLVSIKTGVVEPNPWELFSIEVNHANILHDILDALSYELQGVDSYTGQAMNRTEGQKEKLYSNRIFTASVYLSKLPSNFDRQELGSIFSHVKAEFAKDKGAAHRAEIGKYIDNNLPKLIMVRRWWAL